MELPLKRLTQLFRALSDPTRLRIVNLLDGRFLCVSDIQEALGQPQPFISRHLAILRSARLVRTLREKNTVRYSLSRTLFLSHPLRNFLSEVVPFFPDLQADVQKLKQVEGDAQ